MNIKTTSPRKKGGKSFKVSSPYEMGSHDLSKNHGTNANYARTTIPGDGPNKGLWSGIKKMGGKFLRGEGAFGLLNPTGAVINSVLGKKNPVANLGKGGAQNAVAQAPTGDTTPVATPTQTPTAENVADPNMVDPNAMQS